MFGTWLKHAHPGLPRACTYALAWLLAPLITLLLFPLAILEEGVGVVPSYCRDAVDCWRLLWRQRTTLSSDPWEKVRS